MHTREGAGSGANHGRILLEAAAHLIEKRVGALREGAAPLHPIEELDLAAQTIRQLAAELGRIHEARRDTEAKSGTAPPMPAPRRPAPTQKPPVLGRSSARRAA